MTTERRTLEELEEENTQLREQIATLTRERGERAGRDDAIPYEALFDAHPIPTILYRPDGVIIAINAAACAAASLPAEAFIGKYNVRTDPHAGERGYSAAFERALRGERVKLPPNSFDTAAAGLDGAEAGRLVWVEVWYVPVRSLGDELFIAEVSVDITSQKEAEARVNEGAALLTAIIDNAPLVVYVKDREGRFTLVNRRAEELLSAPREELLGRSDHEFFPREVAEAIRAQDEEVLASGVKTFEDKIPQADGVHAYITTKFPLHRSEGAPLEVAGLSMDITERVRAEEANRRLEEQVLRAHEEALRALSTPLLPISDGVLVMPLIGEVSGPRAQQVLEALLHGITEQQARIAILDITGVSSAGSELTNAIVKVASAVRLLGAELVITGIQPSVAQALVEQSAHLEGIVTQGTLQGGVQYALSRCARERRRR